MLGSCGSVEGLDPSTLPLHNFFLDTTQLATEKIIYIRQTITSILAVQYSISLSFKQLCIRNVEK
jgi:hypothetical protein